MGAAMSQGLPPDAAGVVFRRCRSLSEERAVGRLLAERGSPLVERGVGNTDLFGLWDLTAPAGEALVGAAAVGPLGDSGEVQLRGIAVAAGEGHQGLDRRLVSEVANSLRALGAARLVTRPAGRVGPAVALLRSVGFVLAGADRAPAQVSAPRIGVPPDEEGNWWELEL
jgi:ribosomal protein S18 acetylase RimI-like enzyme